MTTKSAVNHGSIIALLIVFGVITTSVYSSSQVGAASTRQRVTLNSPTKPRTERAIKTLVQTPDNDEEIVLPLRVFIVSDIELEKKQTKMSTWVTPLDVEKSIIPEVNRIWKPAGIQWVIESIIVQPTAKVASRDKSIQYIQDSVREPRDTKNKRFPQRTSKIREFCGKKNQHENILNLYFFPYLGQTYQGFANLSGNTAYIGAWTDKHNRGKKAPEQALLIEPAPMKRGSLGRTVAHELGHNLGLEHPNKSTQTVFNRVMGGRKQGYQLTKEEIKTARKEAIKRAKKILAR